MCFVYVPVCFILDTLRHACRLRSALPVVSDVSLVGTAFHDPRQMPMTTCTPSVY